MLANVQSSKGARTIAFITFAILLLPSCEKSCPHGTTEMGGWCRREDADSASGGTDAGEADDVAGRVSDAGAGKGSRANRTDDSDGHSGGGAVARETDAGQRAGSRAAAGTGGMSGGTGDAGEVAHSGASAGAGDMSAAGATTGSGDSASMCGNGVVEPGELCDGAMCPATCPSRGCTSARLTGSAAMCNAACMVEEIKEAKDGDGCCPTGANAKMDDDCPPGCGDGVVDPKETCEPTSTEKPCPMSCDDNDACTTDMAIGSAMQCTADCMHLRITSAHAGDGCCPQGANANTDSDCKPKCGNGVKEGDETCDGDDCQRSCDDGNECTLDSLKGSPATCDASCQYESAPADTRCKTGHCSASGQCTALPWYHSCANDSACEGGKCIDGVCTVQCRTDDRNSCPAAPGGAQVLCHAVSCWDNPMSGPCSGVCAITNCTGEVQSSCPDHQGCYTLDGTTGQRKLCAPLTCKSDSDCQGGQTCDGKWCVPR
jgi:hypothetical protein